jgi:hypothetical protein
VKLVEFFKVASFSVPPTSSHLQGGGRRKSTPFNQMKRNIPVFVVEKWKSRKPAFTPLETEESHHLAFDGTAKPTLIAVDRV